MSIDDLKKFQNLCTEDKDVMKMAKSIADKPEELMAYAQKELKLEFNLEDIKAMAKESNNAIDELSEEDLEQVSGGKWIIPQDDE